MKQDTAIGTAPGRLDIMGGIADYSGSLVLQMPTKLSTTVKVKRNRKHELSFKSSEIASRAVIPIDRLSSKHSDLRNTLRDSQSSWVAYPLGCWLALRKFKELPAEGLDFEIISNVPVGKGVSSSAALEIATLRALAALYNIDFLGNEIAHLGKWAENQVADAPCGIMDQLASAFGESQKLLPIICQSDQLLEPIPLPKEISFLGIDSGVKHSVSGASYLQVRTAAFAGYQIIAQSLGLDENQTAQFRTTKDRTHIPYHGYLANIEVEIYEKKYAKLLEDTLDKSALPTLLIDNLSQINPEILYNVKSCTAHPIYENKRISTFRSHMLNGHWEEAGSLMYESHQSYNSCGLGNHKTDLIANAAKYLGPANGILGARISGGGNGGTVVVMLKNYLKEENLSNLKDEVAKRLGYKPLIIK